MSADDAPRGRLGAPVSVNGDWVRALERTAAITPASTRTLPAVVAEAAERHGGQLAFLGEHANLTYAALSARADRYGRWARARGLRKGDRVALMLDNQPDYAAIWIGFARVGVVTALLNTQLVGDGLAHCVRVAECRHLIAGTAHLAAVLDCGAVVEVWSHGTDHAACRRIDVEIATLSGDPLPLEETAAVTLRDPALLIYTSGTTGLPKAARVTHYRIMMWSEWFAGIMNATPDDRLFNCLPMYHSVGGVVAVGAMLAAGGTVVVRNGFSASRFWADVATTGATIFQYIGELCRYLLAAPPDRSAGGHTLRLCVGNGLRADVWERFVERFAIPRVIEFYAATEGSFSLFNLEGRPGAIGRIPRFMAHRTPVALVAFDDATAAPIRGSDGFCQRCRTGEIGEAIGMIAAESASLATRFEGYTNAADSERKILRDVFAAGDMWFRTGDLMRQDAAGFFYFVDRVGDTFRWKGENVATSDVADVLAACPGVLDAAVYGVAVPFCDGRAGMAALSTSSGFDLATLVGHLTAHLPRFAQPVFLRIATTMAMTGTFRLKKQDLVRDGFDPNRIGDALYVRDPRDDAFRPVDAACFAEIASGAMRL